MKVVINRCWGGFSLSPKAVARMAELQGRPCYFFDISGREKARRISIEQAEGTFIWSAMDIPEQPEEPKSGASREERTKYNDEYEKHGIDSSPKNRHDPILVRVVEELGEEASGKMAKLHIVEIPDGVEYEIDDYDGMESIHETHRSWS
jgi:hypothetical protein